MNDSRSSLTQHVPILIEDQSREDNASSQGSCARDASPDQPRNLQTTESFNDNVRAKLEVVRQQRLEAQTLQQRSPEVNEPYSRIVKDGKDSNFFSSMVYDGSAEKL